MHHLLQKLAHTTHKALQVANRSNIRTLANTTAEKTAKQLSEVSPFVLFAGWAAMASGVAVTNHSTSNGPLPEEHDASSYLELHFAAP